MKTPHRTCIVAQLAVGGKQDPRAGRAPCLRRGSLPSILFDGGKEIFYLRGLEFLERLRLNLTDALARY